MNTTSNTESLVLRRVAAITQTRVADATGIDGTTLSRILSGERGLRISQLQAFLDALGLRLVEVGSESVTISREEYQALQVLARKALGSEKQ